MPPWFSWVVHRLIRNGHVSALTPEALLLYFFLVLVGDRDGVSYYSDRSMEQHLTLSAKRLQEARKLLIEEGLIAYACPLYQVLSLPGPLGPWPKDRAASSKRGLVSFVEILKTISKEHSSPGP
ncbi:MAG: hypothetical protein ABIK28_08940 [Planctomycetota bacterium]